MLGLTAVFALGVLQASVRAQDTSHATCTDPAYAWSFNSLGQSPCTIGEALGNVCTSDGSFNIQYLPAGYHYSGIGATFATNCVCNTVYYSMLNVCAGCQGGGVAAWDDWSINCTVAYSTFPGTIPADTAIPHYAYLSLLLDGTFDFATAQTDSGPEATFTDASSSASSSRSSSGTPTGSAGASESSGSSNTTSKKSNTNAIVGGVIGGVVFLALIAGGIFWYMRRKKQRTAALQNNNPESSFLAPNMTGTTYSPPPSGGFTDKVYDPNDPSTFPSIPPSTPYTPYTPSAPYNAPQYTGGNMSPEPMSPIRYSVAPSINTQVPGAQQPNTGYRGVAEI